MKAMAFIWRAAPDICITAALGLIISVILLLVDIHQQFWGASREEYLEKTVDLHFQQIDELKKPIRSDMPPAVPEFRYCFSEAPARGVDASFFMHRAVKRTAHFPESCAPPLA